MRRVRDQGTKGPEDQGDQRDQGTKGSGEPEIVFPVNLYFCSSIIPATTSLTRKNQGIPRASPGKARVGIKVRGRDIHLHLVVGLAQRIMC